MAKGPTKQMWKRMIIIMLAMIVLTASVTSYRLVKLMVFDGEFYQAKASEQQLYDARLSAERGNIYDSKMSVLATSASVWTVYITPNSIADIKNEETRNTVKNLIADNLSQILGIDRAKVYGYTQQTSSYYVIIKKKVEKADADKIRKFITDNSKYELSGFIGLDESSKRYYTNDSLASTVLGFVGDDNQGLAGLELKYDSDLTGVPGRVVAAKNAHGTDMPFTYEKVVDAKPGNSLVLTMDSYIQYVTEKYLGEAVINNKVAQRGACLVMNVNTGAILAMATKGDFNPNDPFTLSTEDQDKIKDLNEADRSKQLSDLRNRQWRNKIISDPYEPGSVFKIITAAIGLEEGLTNKNQTFNDPGYIFVAGQRYSCHKRQGHGTQNLVQATQNSCNPFFISLGQSIGVATYSKYFEAFGLTQPTGIDLPGEATSQYHKKEKMGPTELASTSFGQTFKITPIQLLTALSSTVNGGYMVKPHVVEKIVDSDKNVIKNYETVTKRQVVSDSTSKTICELMEAVVDGGGGKNAYVAGYRIGGKTGTSQKVAEMLATGQSGLYVASFCGVAPMEKPEVAILVLLDEPHGENYYGGTISAPVGGQILAEILPYLGYEPHYTEEQLTKLAIKVPDVIGESLGNAKNKISGAKLNYKVVGNGDKVIRQLPSSTQSIYNGGVVILYTEDNMQNETVAVPNFVGLSISQVNSVAANSGLNVTFKGNTQSTSAVVSFKQSVEKDKMVDKGAIIDVYFRSNETGDLSTVN